MKVQVSVTAGRGQRAEGGIDIEVNAASKTDAMIGVDKWLNSAEGMRELDKFAPDRTYYAIHLE